MILTAGSKAAPETGSDGSGYTLARSLGHRIVRPLPALVQLRCKEKIFEKLAGVRMDAKVEVYTEKKLLASDQGEVQFTKNGLSGIPVFQVSRYAVRALDVGEKVQAVLNLMPLFDETQFLTFLKNRREQNSYKHGEQFLTRPASGKDDRLCAGAQRPCKGKKRAEDWTETELTRLAQRSFILRRRSREAAIFPRHRSAPAVWTCREVDPATMESRKAPGLYLAGEILDVDGACGGYNLQWAWSSGWLAGMSAATAGEEKTL